MSILTDFLELVIETAENNSQLAYPISLKELPKEGGLYAELGEGFVESQYYDKTELRQIPLLFLCRDNDQHRCLAQLEAICLSLSRLMQYPQKEGFCWLDAKTAKAPSKIGRDEDGTYHYSCIINCKLYY